MKSTSFLRLLQVERVLQDPAVSGFFDSISRPLAARAVAAVLEEFRAAIKKGSEAPSEDQVIAAAAAACARLAARRLRRVVNATGVLLHTNLGRSPLAAPAADNAAELSTGYCNLELDLETGKRGRRGGLTRELLALLAGAEDALVVNNCAAAVLLCLSALAAGREVLVSRGELVQIGGGFRIPDILNLSGATFREVGTTNITTMQDYLEAVNPNTAAVLVVHASNFVMRGFYARPSIKELAAALPAGLPILIDQGSGALEEGIPGEIPVKRHIHDGAALVCFSGDKLLAGPQSGIVAGRAGLVERLAVHPLMRAVRPGKLALAALEATALARLNGGESLPAGDRLASLKRRARNILRGLPPEAAAVVPSQALFGGGASPDEQLPSISIELRGSVTPAAAVDALRAESPPIIAVIEDDRARLNLASVAPREDRLIQAALRRMFDCSS